MTPSPPPKAAKAKPRVTMTQIARKVGVSVGVVSRLLRDDPTLHISDARRKEILAAVRKAGGIEPRQSRPRLTRVILVPLADERTPAWLSRNRLTGQRWGQFRKTLEAAGFAVHVSLYPRLERESFIDQLLTPPRRADGVLLMDMALTAHDAARFWAQAMPHVGFDSVEESLGLNTVRAHLEAGLRQGVAHLKELGHRRVAFIGSHGHEGYVRSVAAIAANGLPIRQSRDCLLPDLPADADQAAMYDLALEHATRWLREVWPGSGVTAMIAEDDRIACALCQAVANLGLKPGVDLSILGCGHQLPADIHPTGQPPYPLTTVENPFGLVGRRAAERLLAQILHGQMTIVHERLPARLIVQASTGPARKPPGRP